MGVTLRRSKLDETPGVKNYGQGKRTAPKFRWIAVLLVISIPLIYLFYLLLDETVLAEFQGEVVFDTIQIKTPDAGFVDKLFVKEGEHIKKGQSLLQFKSPSLDADLEYLKREKSRIEKQIETINKTSTESLEKSLEVLRKDIVASQLVYDKFAQYYRQQGHMSSVELEQARKNVVSAKEAYAQMEHQIKQVIIENDLMVEVNYKRNLEDINNKITQAEIKKEYFLMKSPANGTIRSIEGQTGEFMPEGQDLIDIVTKNNLHVVAYVAPKSADELQIGATVTMRFPDNFTAKGKVVRMPNYADKTPLNFQNPLSTRENKLVAIVEFDAELPEKYQVFGLPVEIDID